MSAVRALAILVLVVAGAACRSAVVPAAGAANRIEAVLRAQEAAWNRGDVDGFMAAGYWHSPELTFLSGGSWTRGYEPVLARYRARYLGEGREMGRLAFTDLEIEVLDRDVGLARGRWALTFSEASGAEPLAGLFTLVLRRLPEGWRIVHDHTSLDS